MSDETKPPCETCGLRQLIESGFSEMREAMQHSADDRASIHKELSDLRAAQANPSKPDLEQAAALAQEIEARQKLTDKVDKLVSLADRAEGWWKSVTKNKYLKALGIALVIYVVRYLETHGAHMPDVMKGVLP